VPYRPLAFVSGLTLGDYLLWNWSLNSNHDVVALVSGLTLPPLGLVLLWLAVLNGLRLIGRSARRGGGAARPGRATEQREAPPVAAPSVNREPEPAASRTSPAPTSGKLAA